MSRSRRARSGRRRLGKGRQRWRGGACTAAPGSWTSLLAAPAHGHQLTVLHYVADYDTIARVAPVRARWVVPRGRE